MSTRRTRIWIAITAVSVVAIAAAAVAVLNRPGDTAPTASTAEAVRGGELRVALNVDPGTLDPAQQANTYVPSRLLYDSLVSIDTETGEVLPWLAESWVANDDATEFTFTIKEGVTFSDGTALNAEAVKVNFDSVVDNRNQFSSFLAGYEGTIVEDELTATVRFSISNSGFLHAASLTQLAIREPSTLIGKTKEERSEAGTFIGSGPFVLDSYIPNQEVTLVRRDGYDWAPEASTHHGEALLDGIRFLVVPESSARTGLLRSGQVDVDSALSPADEATDAAAGLQVVSRPYSGVVASLFPQISKTRLQDEAVRDALQIAIDREEIVETVLTPNYRPATSSLAANTPGYVDLSDQLRYDPDGAVELLENAGWRIGADGVRERDGVRLAFTLYYLPNTTYATQLYELIQQQLRRIGLDVSIQQVTPADMMASLANPDVDFTAGSQSRPDPDVLRYAFSATNNALNSANLDVSDPFVALVDGISATIDAEQRNTIAAESTRELIERGLHIPLFEIASSAAASPSVGGLGFDAGSRLDYYALWLSAQ